MKCSTRCVSALGIDNEKIDRAAAGKKNAYGQPRNVRGLFDAVFGYDPSVRRDEVSGSIPQALVLMNSPQLARAMNGESPTALGKLLGIDERRQSSGRRALSALPGPRTETDEMQTCLDYVKKTGNRNDAFEDVLWALVNSTEFLHRK